MPPKKKRNSHAFKHISDSSDDSDLEILERSQVKTKEQNGPVKKKQRQRHEAAAEDDDGDEGRRSSSTDNDNDDDDDDPKMKRDAKSSDHGASRGLVTFEHKVNVASLGTVKMFTIKELRHEVWITLVDKVKEWFGIFTYADFELLLRDANADIRHHLNGVHGVHGAPSASAAAAAAAASSSSAAAATSSSSSNAHASQWGVIDDEEEEEEEETKEDLRDDDDDGVEILDIPPDVKAAAKRWNETHVVAACSYVSDKVIERVKQIHEFLEKICKELHVVSPQLTKDDTATLLHLHHIAFVRDVDRAKPIDIKVLLSTIKAEHDAMDDILKLKLRFAKQVKVSAGNPMYGVIQKPAEWDASENWTDDELADGAKLYDVVTEKRIVDDKQAVIMYHGSAIRHMSSFQDRGVAFIGGGALGSGFYMAANPNEAKGYAFSRSGHSVAGLLLEIAVFNADQLVGDVSGQYGYVKHTNKYHFTRNRVAPNQFVFRDTKLFKENFKVLTCYTLEPGFSVDNGPPFQAFAAPAAAAAAAAGGAGGVIQYLAQMLPPSNKYGLPSGKTAPAKKSSIKKSTTTKSNGRSKKK